MIESVDLKVNLRIWQVVASLLETNICPVRYESSDNLLNGGPSIKLKFNNNLSIISKQLCLFLVINNKWKYCRYQYKKCNNCFLVFKSTTFMFRFCFTSTNQLWNMPQFQNNKQMGQISLRYLVSGSAPANPHNKTQEH